MKRDLRVLATAGSLSLALAATDAAFAQKAGGTLERCSTFRIVTKSGVATSGYGDDVRLPGNASDRSRPLSRQAAASSSLDVWGKVVSM
jgi:hypothetical protein